MKVLFLDRDGVVCKLIPPESTRGPRNLKELEFEENIHDLLNRFKSHGYQIAIITNQPDISRKLHSLEDFGLVQSYIHNHLPISRTYFCPHQSSENCACRKPKPGLLQLALADFNANPADCILIGDRITDVIAASHVGIKPFLFIEKNDRVESLEESELPENCQIINSLLDPLLLAELDSTSQLP